MYHCRGDKKGGGGGGGGGESDSDEEDSEKSKLKSQLEGQFIPHYVFNHYL